MIMCAINPACLVPKPGESYVNSLNTASHVDPNISDSFTSQGMSGPAWVGDFSQSTTEPPFHSKQKGEFPIYSGSILNNLNDEPLTINYHSTGSNHEESSAYNGSTSTHTNSDIFGT